MAKLVGTYPFPVPEFGGDMTWEQIDKVYERQDGILTRLVDNWLNAPDDRLLEAVLSFQVADGYAYYIVTKENPLEVKHIPYMDGYTAHPLIIKGLDREYIIEQKKREKKFKKLFR